MIKKILQEYFAAFRWGRIKECYQGNLLFLALGLSIMIILATAMQERIIGSIGTLTTTREWWETGTLIIFMIEFWVLSFWKKS